MYSICPVNSGSGNNGNLKGYVEYHGGPGYPQFLAFSQQFGYDGLNRLTSIGDSGGYSRNFAYGAYGNMAVQSFSGIGLSSLTPYSGSGNNPFDGSNRLRNAGYDLVGNQTNVGSLQIEHRSVPWLISASLIYLSALLITGDSQAGKCMFQ